MAHGRKRPPGARGEWIIPTSVARQAPPPGRRPAPERGAGPRGAARRPPHRLEGGGADVGSVLEDSPAPSGEDGGRRLGQENVASPVLAPGCRGAFRVVDPADDR